MSTYSQDITQLIHKIETNIPDNDTQYITAARIRDSLGAISYNYDLYAKKIDIPDLTYYVSQNDLQSALEPYVTKDELSQCGYVTQSQLSANSYLTSSDISNFITEQDVQNILVEGSYVTSNELSQAGYINTQYLDQASYVSFNELSEQGYVTESQLQLAGYVSMTQLSSMTYLTSNDFKTINGYSLIGDGDIVISGGGSIDLSSYVTKDELSAAGYLTSIPSNYITQSQLDEASYITINDVPTVDLSSYVTYDFLSSQSYLQEHQSLDNYPTFADIENMGYVSMTQLTSMTYVTESQLQTELSAYVTTSDLNTELGDYPTINDLNLTLQDYVSYSQFNTYTSDFVVDNDLQDFVSKDELSQAGYITSSALSGLATETYVADYVAQHVPTPDLSAYVTKTELSAQSYLTSIPSEYITETELSAQGYVTNTSLQSQLQQAGYVSQAQLSANSYITSSALSGLATEQYVDTAVGAIVVPTKTSDLTNDSGFITSSALSGLATETYVAEYVNTYVPEPDMSAYLLAPIVHGYSGQMRLYNDGFLEVTTTGNVRARSFSYNQLNSWNAYTLINRDSLKNYVNGRLAEIEASYATKVELPKIDESIIPNTTNTYTLGDSSHFYDAAYVSSIKFTGDGISSISATNSTTLRLAPAEIGFYLETSGFRPGTNGNKFLGTSSNQWGYTYARNFIENGTNISDIYTQAYVLTQSQYDGLSQDDKEKETIYIISDQQSYMNNELVTESSLDSRGFLTAANFNYDPTTQTLTLNL